MAVLITVRLRLSQFPSQVAHHAGAYPSFFYVKATKSIIILPPSWMVASLSQGYPPPPAFHQASLKDCRYPFIFLDGERHCESYLFCPRTQHIDPATGPVPGPLDPVHRINHKATACPALNIMTDTQKESSHVKTDN